MRKIINNILFSVLIIITFFFSLIQAKAISINKISMDVYIDDHGDATITEVWETKLTQGTEIYKSYTNLPNSVISNFSVSDETGRLYEKLSSWNTSANFDNKAYKSGLNYIPDGVELCWGVSSYGNKTYTLKYNMTNFVNQYTDTQGIYINLINLDQYVSNAKITIHSDYPFSLDNAKIWAFGNNGTINFENGNIVLDSGGSLSPSQYMVVLVRFESNIFNTENTVSKSFDNIYDSAMSDVNDNEDNNSSGGTTLLLSLLLVPVIILIPVIFLTILIKKFGIGNHSVPLDFGPSGQNIPPEDKIEYWREIPCDKDLERAYWVAYKYKIVPIDTLNKGIIGAILLKWFKEEKITVSSTRKGLFNFKDNNYAVDLNKLTDCENKIENNLLAVLKSASGMNGILEANELKKWCKKNWIKIESLFSMFLCEEQIELENQQLITPKFDKAKTIIAKVVSPVLLSDAIHLKGLKKFLLDFSMIAEREYFEVHIWDEYLIFAHLLGIADKVEEQFSKLYPNFNQVSKLDINITTKVIRGIVDNGYSGYQKAIVRRRYDYSGTSRRSGGGGLSYRSGGSSSGGSSGGGVR